MRIKPNEERAFMEFAAEQRASAGGQAMLKFMEEWSAMMECAIDRGVKDTPEIASITLCAAAETAGITTDDAVVDGGINLLRFWTHGDGLEEWLTYHPEDSLLDGPANASSTVWCASRELLEALPEMVEAYPGILRSAPDILDIRQARLDEGMSETVPTMSMSM